MTKRSKDRPRRLGSQEHILVEESDLATTPVALLTEDTKPSPWRWVKEFHHRLCQNLGTHARMACLRDENRSLNARLESVEAELQAVRQDREMLQSALRNADERTGDLERKCKSLEGQLECALRTVEEQKATAIASLLTEMAAERANRLLLKILDAKGGDETLRQLAAFLGDKGVELVHTKGEQIELTASKQHEYILREQATLPCHVEVIARGIRIGGRLIIRPEVRVLG